MRSFPFLASREGVPLHCIREGIAEGRLDEVEDYFVHPTLQQSVHEETAAEGQSYTMGT